MTNITDADIQQLIDVGAVSISAMFPDTTDPLWKDAQRCSFKRRETRTETGVTQDFLGVDAFPQDTRFQDFAAEAASELAKEFEGKDLLTEPLAFNDLSLQLYPPSQPGQDYAISPHVDHKMCINLVAVFLLEGASSFFICSNRQGDDPFFIDAGCGDMILMRGFGFAGIKQRPFHFVGPLFQQRLTFALRQTIAGASIDKKYEH